VLGKPACENATLIPGNLAVLGLCSNTSACLGSSADDDETTNVGFPVGSVINACTIGTPASGFTEAESNDITIGVGRTSTNNSATSQLDVYGNYLNNATLTHTNGTVTFRRTAQPIGSLHASYKILDTISSN